MAGKGAARSTLLKVNHALAVKGGDNFWIDFYREATLARQFNAVFCAARLAVPEGYNPISSIDDLLVAQWPGGFAALLPVRKENFYVQSTRPCGFLGHRINALRSAAYDDHVCRQGHDVGTYFFQIRILARADDSDALFLFIEIEAVGQGLAKEQIEITHTATSSCSSMMHITSRRPAAMAAMKR